MADRQVEHVMAQLAAITVSAKTIIAHAPDLHSLGYERTTTGRDRTAGGDWPPPGVETHGDEHARELWHRLEEALKPMELSLRALEWAVGNLLSQGASPKEFHGDPPIARAEFRAALKQQRARVERGEYVPTRTIDQPPYPGTGTG